MKFELGKQFIFIYIYVLFKNKLGIFWKYLEKNWKKWLIRKSQLIVR